MYEITANKWEAYAFAQPRLRLARTQHMKGIALKKDGEIIAAVVYDDYNGQNVTMHIAAIPGGKWMTRQFLHEAFKHPFVTLGVKRITGIIHSDNEASIKLAEHLGFRREGVLSQAGSMGQDVYLYVMFREDCRYVDA